MRTKKAVINDCEYYVIRDMEKKFYGKTSQEAVQKRDEYKLKLMHGLNPDKEKTEFLPYALCWVANYRSDCGGKQRKQYESMMKTVSDFVKKKYIRDYSATDIQRFINTLTDYSASYINKLLYTLRGVFKLAVSDGVIIINPLDSVRRNKTKKVVGHRALEPWERNLIRTTCHGHEFGLLAMTMLYAGLRRGEALYIDVDRDVDFEKKTITVRGAVSYPDGNQAVVSEGKTDAAKRVIPLVKPLEIALLGHHGLLCEKASGGLMSHMAFERKYESYITYLETCYNGCHKRWYGKTKEQKKSVAEGNSLKPWKDINIHCHDLRVDYCTRNYEAGIPIKTLQKWMGHSSATMIMNVYAKLTEQQEMKDAAKLTHFMDQDLIPGSKDNS